MTEKVHLYIADAQQLFRKALVSLFKEHDKNIVVIGEAENGKVLLELLRKKQPDVLLLDLEMPVMDGFEAFGVIRKRYPQIKVVILSAHNDKKLISNFIKNGARGYLQKDCNPKILLDAIHTVYQGEIYFDNATSYALLNQVKNTDWIGGYEVKLTLTNREMQIVKYICEGKTNKEIASSLNIERRTVEFHRSNIFKKTRAGNPIGLAVYAAKNGIISFF